MGCRHSATVNGIKKDQDSNRDFLPKTLGHKRDAVSSANLGELDYNLAAPIGKAEKQGTFHNQLLKFHSDPPNQGHQIQISKLKTFLIRPTPNLENFPRSQIAVYPEMTIKLVEFSCLCPKSSSSDSETTDVSEIQGSNSKTKRKIYLHSKQTEQKQPLFIIGQKRQHGYTSFAQYRDRVSKLILPLTKKGVNNDILTSVKKIASLSTQKRKNPIASTPKEEKGQVKQGIKIKVVLKSHLMKTPTQKTGNFQVICSENSNYTSSFKISTSCERTSCYSNNFEKKVSEAASKLSGANHCKLAFGFLNEKVPAARVALRKQSRLLSLVESSFNSSISEFST